MTTPITPRELFVEFSALADSARDSEDYASMQAYNTIVDLVDGMTKGATSDRWEAIYTALRDAAKHNRDMYVIMNQASDSGALAWNDIMEALDIAITTCNR